MNGQGVYKKTIILFFTICFVAILLSVSFLGENSKANTVVISFLKNVKKHDYERAQRELSPHAFFYDKKEASFVDFAFLLELSLILKFDILDINDYQIDVKRNSFWLPYFSNNRMKLSVRLRKKESNIFQTISSLGGNEYLEDLFVLERIRGMWQIVKIKTDDPSIDKIFHDLKEKLNKNNYYVKTKDGFIMQRFEFNNKEILPVERHLYNYVLHKAINSIREAT